MINQEKIANNIELILDKLDIEYKKQSNRLSFACPIHEGSKKNGAVIYPNGIGTFRCFTANCHAHHNKGLLGFVHDCLKFDKLNKTVDWIENLIGQNISEEDGEFASLKRKSIVLSSTFTNKKRKEEHLINRKNVVENLQIPANYFINRGYLSSTLMKYDVGLCSKFGKQMYNRIVAPVYDDNYEFMVGCMGRTQKPECNLCRKYHNENEVCPISSLEEYFSSKWINSIGFNGENYLYNYWFAKKKIEDKKTVILVEGAGDVWRLEEANIGIGLGLFGAHLTDKQAEKLEKLPIINLVIATDNDDAGNKARSLIKEKLWRQYNIFDINLPSKDIGELSIEQTKEVFNPLLEKLYV